MAETLLSIQEYDADGVRTVYEFSFAGGYISRDDVYAISYSTKDEQGNPIDPVTEVYTWISDFTISIEPAIAVGKTVRIYRSTPYSAPIVNFSDGSIINELTLDLNAKQAVFLAAEARDRVGTQFDAVLLGEILNEAKVSFQEIADIATAETGADVAATNADVITVDASRAAAELAEAGALGAQVVAEEARDAAQAASVEAGYYPGARSFVPRGLTAVTITAAGTGGTDGTYICPLTGDNLTVDAYAQVVVTGGVVTSAVMSAPGLYVGASPTPGLVDTASITGLTGATLTPTISYLRTSGQFYLTDHATDPMLVSRFQNQSNAAVEVDAAVDWLDFSAVRAAALAVTSVVNTVSAWATQSYTYTNGFYISEPTGALAANVNYRYTKVPLTGAEVSVRVSGRQTLGAGGALAVYYAADGTTKVGSEVLRTNPTTQILYTNQVLHPPTSARFLGLCNLLNETAFTVEYQNVSANIAPRLATVETGVASNAADISDLGSALGEWQTYAYTYVNGFYFNATTGAPIANASFRYCYMALDGSEQAVRVSGSYNLGTGLAAVVYFSDAGATVKIGGELIGNNLPHTLTDYELTIPAGTVKIGFDQRTTDVAFALSANRVATDLITRVAALEAGGAAPTITLWGDSMSENSALGIGNEIAGLFPTRTVYQMGIGGQQWMTKIRYRLGIEDMAITITGGVIPTSGTAACTLTAVGGGALLAPYFNNNYDAVAQVMVKGVRCALRWAFGGTTAHTIQALDTIAGPVTVASGSVCKVLTGHVFGTGGNPASCIPLNTLLGGVQIIRSAPSINDQGSIDPDAHTAAIDRLLEALGKFTDRVVVVGMINGAHALPTTYSGGTKATEADSYAVLTWIRAMNDYMRRRVPCFVDAQGNHVANGGSETITVSGVGFPVLTNTASVPKLVDSLHENTTAQAATAALVQAAMAAKNW